MSRVDGIRKDVSKKVDNLIDHATREGKALREDAVAQFRASYAKLDRIADRSRHTPLYVGGAFVAGIFFGGILVGVL